MGSAMTMRSGAAQPGGAELAAPWARVQSRLKSELGEATFNSWIRILQPLDMGEGIITLSVPTRFQKQWVQNHFADRLCAAWAAELPETEGVEFLVDGAIKAVSTAAPEEDDKDDVPAGLPPLTKDEIFAARLDPRFTFDNFVLGKSNELAYAAARRVADSNNVSFNPLFLHGGVGLGKTHLMHAIAWAIKERDPSRKVLYLSAEKFMFQFIRALRFKDTMAFKEQFRSVDVLMIDDVQFIAHKNSTQEEFFHTFNALIDHHHQIVISADRSPSDLEGIEDRIRSRLGWGLVADIHPTDYELRLGILQSKAERLRAAIPQAVLEFLAHRISSNVRELEGALNRVAAYADLVGRTVTLDMTQEVLQDLLRANDRKVTVEEIQRKVSDYFNLKLADMMSARRSRAVARPRQVAMYLAKQMTTRSLPEIGRKFGGRDHTTVMHAVKKIEELRQLDSSLDEDLTHLKRSLEG